MGVNNIHSGTSIIMCSVVHNKYSYTSDSIFIVMDKTFIDMVYTLQIVASNHNKLLSVFFFVIILQPRKKGYKKKLASHLEKAASSACRHLNNIILYQILYGIIL